LLFVCALASPSQLGIYGSRYVVVREMDHGEPVKAESLTPQRFLHLLAKVYRIHEDGVFHNDLRPPNLIAPPDPSSDIEIIDWKLCHGNAIRAPLEFPKDYNRYYSVE